MAPPYWLDEFGHRVPTRKCARPGCGREYPVRRYRYDTFRQIGWSLYRVASFTNWCGHGQEFVPWPEADGLWALVPVVDAVANRRT
jgi:hypothetical protein